MENNNSDKWAGCGQFYWLNSTSMDRLQGKTVVLKRDNPDSNRLHPNTSVERCC